MKKSKQSANFLPLPLTTGYYGPATIINTAPDYAHASVMLSGLSQHHEAWAGFDRAQLPPLSGGDEVLVAGESIDQLQIIGVQARSENRDAVGA